MFDKLGRVGIVGILSVFVGLLVIALADPVIAGGVALVLVGVGLVVRGLFGFMLNAMGMGGMF